MTPRNPSKTQTQPARSPLAGFTLVEAIIATLVLSIGLMAVSNLSVIAIGSTSVANRTTASSLVAAQKLEELKATPFSNLADTAANALEADTTTGGVAAFSDTHVAGVGRFHTRWRVATVGAFGTTVKYIAVRSEALGVMGRMTRSEFTTVRSCTTPTGAAGSTCPAM